jgi:hypothetical protein
MIADLELRPNEVVSRSIRANRSQGNRAVGGKVHVTNQRVVFVPHAIDKNTGGQSWEVLPQEITAVDVAPRGKNIFNGSIRRRLRITTQSSTEHFVIGNADEVAAEIALLLRPSPGSSTS